MKGDMISNSNWDSVLSYWEYCFRVGDQMITTFSFFQEMK